MQLYCNEAEKIINGIIKNEFNHIQEFKELDFINKNEILTRIEENESEVFNELTKNLPEEQKKILDKFNDLKNTYWLSLCEFYFKEGIATGLTNLNFLNEIKNIQYFL